MWVKNTNIGERVASCLAMKGRLWRKLKHNIKINYSFFLTKSNKMLKYTSKIDQYC